MDLYRNAVAAFPNFGGQNAPASSSGFNTTTLVYILLVAFVIYIVGLMLMSKPLDLSWLDPRPKSMKVTADAYLFWKPSAIFTNLVVKAGSVPGFKSTEYSAIVDTILLNTRTFKGSGGPWRHIVHRGSDELAISTVGGAVLRTGCAAASNRGGALPPFGLPKRMNPGIFLDPNTNDVVVFVDTERGGDNFRESVRLVDIPMDIPFRIGVIVNGKVLEVYLNCKLEVSKVLKGRPRSVEDTWYGLSGSAAAAAQIQNFYVWTRALPADQIGSICTALPKFEVLRPTCDMADSPLPESKTPKPPQIGYGNALSTCAPPR